MEIGQKLRDARTRASWTQEHVAEELHVSRQTISNWENERSYPDIVSVITLSSLYEISLDDLLKGDSKMLKHLEESTNIVKSNRKLIGVIAANILLMVLLIALSFFVPASRYYLVGVFCLFVVGLSVLMHQIIRRF